MLHKRYGNANIRCNEQNVCSDKELYANSAFSF